jgi:hypothetical protein
MGLGRTDGRQSGLEDWSRPKRNYQWKPGRSAMELARAMGPMG